MTELRYTELRDQRRTQRLVRLVSALAQNPTGSLPEACGSWADTKAAYRFLDNPDIEPEAILSGHRQSTLKRAGDHNLILIVQDTTTMSFTTHRATKGLGPVSGKLPDSDVVPMGFLVHSCLAVTPEGVPIGLLGHKLWVRPAAEGASADGEQAHLSPAAKDEKESLRWEELLESSTRGIPAGTQVLTVADREADFYNFFAKAQGRGHQVLVRAAHNRRLAKQLHRLWDVLERAPVVGTMTIEVPRAQERPPRTATLELRIAQVALREPPSARTKSAQRMKLNAVLARELDPPADQEPIIWRLLTTLPVASAEDARNCVRWYVHRWKVERYHYILKSGCQIEELELETVERLHRALAVYSIVASRLLHLTYLARVEPNLSCTEFLSDSEWKALYCSIHRTTRLPKHPPDLQTAVLWIARLGGFLARKRDGAPGVKVLWRGYRRLQDRVSMWELFRSDQN